MIESMTLTRRQASATAALAADDTTDALVTLRLRTEAQAALAVAEETHELVSAARDAGRTWTEVGKALGTTADAARWSWEGSLEDRKLRLAAARKRSSARPSTRPADLPGSAPKSSRPVPTSPSVGYT